MSRCGASQVQAVYAEARPGNPKAAYSGRKINSPVEKRGQVLKKSAMIAQEPRQDAGKSSQGAGWPPGCPDEGLPPWLPVPRGPALWNPPRNPRGGEEPFPAEQAAASKT